MPYIGNTIRAADDYRLIDDISSGFNGSETSFALQVAGSAPVPFPKSPQQVLISVNGVIQEPDPTGSSGFNLVGTNIVFSSAPTNGHAFFGIIYATADYLNAGGNFPAGSLGAPSITFIGDENSGLYRKGSGSIGFVADATEIANTDSNGLTISSGDLILGDNRKAKFGAGDDLQIFHDGSNSFINEVGTGGLFIRAQNTFNLQKAGTSEFMIKATSDGSVELFHDNSKKLETFSTGVKWHGFLFCDDNSSIRIGNGADLQIFHDGSNSKIVESGTGSLVIQTSNFNLDNAGGTENILSATENGAVELYYDNNKKFETTSGGVTVTGSLNLGSGDLLLSGNVDLEDSSGAGNNRIKLGTSDDLQIYHDGSHSRIDDLGTGALLLQTNGANIQLNKGTSENMLIANVDGSVELYHNNVKKFETSSVGANVSGNFNVNDGILVITHSTPIIKFEDNSGSSGGDFAINVNGNQFKIVDTDNSDRMGFQFGSDGNTALGGNTTFNGDIRASADSTHDVGTNSVRFANGYFDTLYGDGSNLTGISSGAISSIANDGANRLLTSDGDGTATAHQDFNVANQRLTCRHTSSGTTYPLFLQNRTNGDSRVGIQMIATGSDISDGQFAAIEARGQLAGNTSHQLVFKTCTSGGTPTDRLNIDINGHTLPGADNTYNLGSGSVRWANVFTADLKLSNKGSQNDVDSTWGNYTIQEGHEDLFLINHRTGKKFKFNLTEVS